MAIHQGRRQNERWRRKRDSGTVNLCRSFLLGEDGEKALMAHVEDKDGIIDAGRLISEFLEVTQIAGEKIKKSQSSSNS